VGAATPVPANFVPPEADASVEVLRFLTGSWGVGAAGAKPTAGRPAPATARAEPAVAGPGPGATGHGWE